MADDNSGGNSGGWFPNLNNLLLILLAGTLLIGQQAYHESRPSKPDAKPAIADVDARLWQDPFEAVKQYIEKNPKSVEGDGKDRLQNLQKDIEAKLKLGNDDKGGELNVLAVMLPGAPYYEDGEIRRRLRYAALSGFNAALRYTPENPNYINFFKIAKNDQTLPEQHVAYEWMTYKPDNKLPPVLILWLDNDKFRGKPHQLLVKLLKRVQNAKNTQKPITFKVNVLGPYDSDNLQDMVREFGKTNIANHKDLSLNFYSPSASVQDSSLLKDIPGLNESFEEDNGLILTHPEYFLFFRELYGDQCKPTSMQLFSTCAASPPELFCIGIPKEPYFLDTIYVSVQSSLPFPVSAYNFFANYLGRMLTLENLPIYSNLQQFFKQKGGLNFLRVNSSDQHLAVAIKQELFKRGIAVGENSRVLLLSEWDTLYGLHLPDTFAAELIKPFPENGTKNYPLLNKCTRDGNEEAKYNETDKLQDGGQIYDENIQCVFRFSYLRGLDGEKAKSGDKPTPSGSKNDAKDKNGQPRNGENLEDAEGDSQFDYVRRMANQIAELDEHIKKDKKLAAHAIQVIGILGSDVYDKLLILEAMHDKFPDAMFFTNGLDARFLHPEDYKWARNLLLASTFDLTLDRQLQRDIPPFRDSTQTAYFLATEMAIAGIAKDDPVVGGYWRLPDEYKYFFTNQLDLQEDFDKLLMYPRVKEVGRTRFSDVSFNPTPNSVTGLPKIHPNLSDKQGNGLELHKLEIILKILKYLSLGIIIISSLYYFRISHDYLSSLNGFLFILFMLLVCFFVPHIVRLLINKSGSWITQGYGLLSLLFFIGLIYLIVIALLAIYNNSIENAFNDILNSPSNGNKEKKQKKLSDFIFTLSIIFIVFVGWWLFWVTQPTATEWLNGGEQYSFSEGISMWPTEGLRLIALVVTSYLIIDVYRFWGIPKWLTTHKIDKLEKSNFYGCKPLILWVEWWNTKSRMSRPMIMAILFFYIGMLSVYSFGMPNIPHRGEAMFFLDHVLMRGLLVPAYALLLFLVVDAVNHAVVLVDKSFPHEDKPDERTEWPREIRRFYAQKLAIGENELHEWVSMRFVNELTEGIYRIIGYPLIVCVIIVVARSTYFDNWHMPIALKVIIGFSLGMLIFCDYRLKGKADEARSSALKWLRQRVVYCNGLKSDSSRNKGPQLEKLIGMIENSENVVYQSFFQRPIFRNSLLIVVALLADSVDYTGIASKLF